MSKLLRETLIENKHEIQTLSSETGFVEIFVNKGENLDFKNINIKLRSSHAYNYKCLNKVHEESKYKGKIIFPIIETIILDKGQINHWVFTDQTAGYVLKKNSNKLIKDNVLRYFAKVALDKIIEEGKKVDRSLDRIMEDIHRFVIISDQNYSRDYVFVDEFSYLNDFHNKIFIYLKFSGNVEKIVNIIELFNWLGDPNKITNLLLIQNFINIDKSKAIYCRFYRKNILAPKKFQLYSKVPNIENEIEEKGNYLASNNNAKTGSIHSYQKNSITLINNNTNSLSNSQTNFHTSNMNLQSNNFSHNNYNSNGTNFSSNNNNNNSNNPNNQINGTNILKKTNSKTFNIQPNLTHKKNVLSKKKVISSYDDDEEQKKEQIDINDLIPLNDNNLTQFISCISDPFVELLEKSLGIFIYEVIFMFNKDTNGSFYFRLCDDILCKSRKTPDELGEEKRLKETMKNIYEKTIPKEIRKNVRKYEKVTKNAFCFGEFCNYNIPKFFKNMNKFNKEDLNEYKNIDSKLIERNKNHDFAFVLPYFLIKKAYDNENLVNILLKAYSIFPKNFDKDQVLLQLQKEKILEDQRKEEENKKEDERQKKEEKMKRLGNAGFTAEELKELNYDKKIKNSATISYNDGDPEIIGKMASELILDLY